MFKNYNILCVDDESINLDIVKEILHNYTVYPVVNATDAFKVLDNVEIDLILLDIMMPDISGFELCKRIKDETATNNIPILFMTTNEEDQTIYNAFEYGGVDFIKKPLNIIELQQRVKLHLKQKTIFQIDQEYSFDQKAMILYRNKQQIQLSKSEKKLLKLFVSKIGIPTSPIDISIYIYNDTTKEYNNKTIRNLISSLKNKLPKGLIKNNYAQGYYLSID